LTISGYEIEPDSVVDQACASGVVIGLALW
jgi:hypothetical protein